VYRSTVSGGSYVRLASKVPDVSYTDTIVNSGRTYFYVVTAVDESGQESRYSNETRAVIP
jgi:fibronectin type 3 domain-containing protein